MKAAVFHGEGSPLTIEEVGEPRDLGPGEVLVRVAACGVCASDLHYLHGTPTFKKPPLILGHEISGFVEDVARDVKELAPGEAVIVPPLISCGDCANCREGRDNICYEGLMIGNSVDGGFAEFIKVPARMLHKIPSNLPVHESAVISDAVSTPFHAVKNRGEVKPGEWVAVFGCGGVGLNAVQAAAALGASVIAVDIDERKLRLARELGAVETINPQEVDVAKSTRSIAGRRGVDAAFEVVGKPSVMEQALEVVRPGGRLVIVGYSHKNWDLRVSRVMFREISVIGSLGCRSAEYPYIIRLVERGLIKLGPIISERMPLEKINDALKRLEEGAVVGRQIIVL